MGKRKATTMVQPLVTTFPLAESETSERERRLAVMAHVRARHLSGDDFLRSLTLQSRVYVGGVPADIQVRSFLARGAGGALEEATSVVSTHLQSTVKLSNSNSKHQFDDGMRYDEGKLRPTATCLRRLHV